MTAADGGRARRLSAASRNPSKIWRARRLVRAGVFTSTSPLLLTTKTPLRRRPNSSAGTRSPNAILERAYPPFCFRLRFMRHPPREPAVRRPNTARAQDAYDPRSSDGILADAVEASLGHRLPGAGNLLLGRQSRRAAQLIDHVRIGVERHLRAVPELLRQLGDRRALPDSQ